VQLRGVTNEELDSLCRCVYPNPLCEPVVSLTFASFLWKKRIAQGNHVKCSTGLA
jgi:hypothetical protein